MMTSLFAVFRIVAVSQLQTIDVGVDFYEHSEKF